MTVAIGYKRLSQDSDTSIERQDREIREYADARGWEIDRVYNDGERSSGFDDEREEYQLARERIAAGDVDVILVYDRTRIGRDFDERMRFVLDLRANDVELHTALDGPVDLSEPSKVVFESFHAAKDDEGKREEIKKSKQAVEERQANGCYQGTPPIGLEFADDKCHLRKSERWADLERAFGLFDGDLTLAEISDEVGIGVSTLSRMRSRGRSYYEERLSEYGNRE